MNTYKFQRVGATGTSGSYNTKRQVRIPLLELEPQTMGENKIVDVG